MESLDERTKRALATRSLSLAEYLVLSSAAACPYRPADDFIAYCLGASEGDPRSIATELDLEGALAQCIRRGLVTRATTERLATWRARTATHPSIASLPEPGAMVLTDEGFAVERDMDREIHGPEMLERRDSGWTLRDGGAIVLVLACAAHMGRRLAAMICDSPESFLGEPRSVHTVSEPEAIGRWFPNCYASRARGFRVTVEMGEAERD